MEIKFKKVQRIVAKEPFPGSPVFGLSDDVMGKVPAVS